MVVSHLSNLEIGRPAVFAFFALSGYWVTRMYVEKHSKFNALSVFYASRALRIFLPFLAAYVSFFILNAGIQGQANFTDLFGLAIFGIASTQKDVLGVSWSLDIELQFYLLVPLIAFLSRRAPSPRVAGLGLFGISILLLPIGWMAQLQSGLWTVFSYLPSFLIGVWIYQSGWKPSKKTAYLSAACFVFIGITVWAWADARPLLMKDTPSPFHEDWFGMAWTAILAPFYAYNVQQRSSHLDRHYGNLSYALYITHWPTIAIFSLFSEPFGSWDKPVALIIVAVVGVTFYRIVEVPSEMFRASIVSRLSSREP